jgi:DNA-binding NarL/FixJ family response regulator
VLSLFEDSDPVFLALRAGACGYLLTDADEEELTGAIRAVARGEAIFSQAVAGRVLAFSAQPRPAPKVFPELTDREREMLTRRRARRLSDGSGHESGRRSHVPGPRRDQPSP